MSSLLEVVNESEENLSLSLGEDSPSERGRPPRTTEQSVCENLTQFLLHVSLHLSLLTLRKTHAESIYRRGSQHHDRLSNGFH